MNKHKTFAYLALAVNTHNSRCGIIGDGNEDGLVTDAVHVDAGARFNVVGVQISIFGNQEHDGILLGGL